MLVRGVPLEHHQRLIVEDEIGSFVEGGEDAEGLVELEGEAAGLDVAAGRALAQRYQPQHRPRQRVADPGDGADSAAADKAVEHLRVDADHEGEVGITRGDEAGGVAQRFGATKLFEADEVLMVPSQVGEQLGAGLEAVVGAVVDHGGEIAAGREHLREVGFLGRRRAAAREKARDHHQAHGPDLAGVGRMGSSGPRALGTGADDDRHACLDEEPDAGLPLLVGQQRPVSHRAAVDDRAHPRGDESLRGAHELLVVERAIGPAGGHECRHATAEDVGTLKHVDSPRRSICPRRGA